MEIKIDGDRRGVEEVCGGGGGGGGGRQLVQQILRLSARCRLYGVWQPVANRTLPPEKGLRHMVIQIQFRYSRLTHLQQKERPIGQVGRLAQRKGA